MKKQIFMLSMLLFSLFSAAQIHNPVKWSFSTTNISDTETELVITANIEKGWHLYSQFLADNGPVPTTFKFDKSVDFTLIGKVK